MSADSCSVDSFDREGNPKSSCVRTQVGPHGPDVRANWQSVVLARCLGVNVDDGEAVFKCKEVKRG